MTDSKEQSSESSGSNNLFDDDSDSSHDLIDANDLIMKGEAETKQNLYNLIDDILSSKNKNMSFEEILPQYQSMQRHIEVRLYPSDRPKLEQLFDRCIVNSSCDVESYFVLDLFTLIYCLDTAFCESYLQPLMLKYRYGDNYNPQMITKIYHCFKVLCSQ